MARFKLLLSGELAALKPRTAHLSGEDGVMWKCGLSDMSSKPWRRHTCAGTHKVRVATTKHEPLESESYSTSVLSAWEALKRFRAQP